MIEKSLTTKQVAEFLGITVNTLREYRTLGIGPAYFILPNGVKRQVEKREYLSVRYLLSDILAWVEERKLWPEPRISGAKRRKRVKYEARRLMKGI